MRAGGRRPGRRDARTRRIPGGLKLRRGRTHWRRDLSVLAAPAREQVGDGDNYGQRRQYEYSVKWVHPVEGLPSAESGYVFITKNFTRLGVCSAYVRVGLKYGSRPSSRVKLATCNRSS
jgi:hypothetical protein